MAPILVDTNRLDSAVSIFLLWTGRLGTMLLRPDILTVRTLLQGGQRNPKLHSQCTFELQVSGGLYLKD